MLQKATTDIDKQVGVRIRAARQAAKVSQTSLAEALGITFQQVQKYENGANRVGASRLAEIAKTLRVPVSYFFESPDGSAWVSDLLADPQVLELLCAFGTIKNEALRRAIVDIVVVASGTGAASTADGAGASTADQKRGAAAKSGRRARQPML